MTRLNVEAQGQLEAEVVPLEENECVVLGRVPDVSDAAAHLPPLPATRRSRPIASPSVSATHAAVWLEDGHVKLVDLDSRNGTWVRIPRGTVVTVPAAAELHVRLASAVWVTGPEQHPEPARYSGAADFGAGVAQSIRGWLQRRDVPARVWAAVLTGGAGGTGVTPLRLANGESLFIQPERTVDGAFHERMVQICRFVSTQNTLFTAEEDTRTNGMVLASAAIRQVHRRIVELAMQNLPSLVLLGASGTGKERLAQAFHRNLGRSGPLVAINCAMLSRDRVVADLFGAEAGAYTDAKRTTLGAVERADGGTLFLDELGELPADVQPLLLRFLESGEYQRLGAIGRPRFADVRVVAATNRDLRRMVRDGTFREDLFFRLALEVIEVPPLRDRFADIETFLRGQLLGETSVVDALHPDALELLRSYGWSGNFRELMNFVRRLPRPCGVAALSVDVVRRSLEAGTIGVLPAAPIRPPVDADGHGDLADWLAASTRVFARNMDGNNPASWSDVSSFVEHYLKPWALAHLAGVAAARRMEDISVGQIAERVKADRGTVVKQLRRYFEMLED